MKNIKCEKCSFEIVTRCGCGAKTASSGCRRTECSAQITHSLGPGWNIPRCLCFLDSQLRIHVRD